MSCLKILIILKTQILFLNYVRQ